MSITVRCRHCGREIPIRSQYCLGCGSTEVQDQYDDYIEYWKNYTPPSPEAIERERIKKEEEHATWVASRMPGHIIVGAIFGFIIGFIVAAIFELFGFPTFGLLMLVVITFLGGWLGAAVASG